MEDSILKSTKKLLNIHESDTSFDLDILTFINSTFSTLNELGVKNDTVIVVEDDTKTWSELGLSVAALSAVKTYVYLKARLLFDPPATSFAIASLEKILHQQEWRLAEFHDDTVATTYPPDPIEEVV